jgi:hypothetical protein
MDRPVVGRALESRGEDLVDLGMHSGMADYPVLERQRRSMDCQMGSQMVGKQH